MSRGGQGGFFSCISCCGKVAGKKKANNTRVPNNVKSPEKLTPTQKEILNTPDGRPRFSNRSRSCSLES